MAACGMANDGRGALLLLHYVRRRFVTVDEAKHVLGCGR